MTKAKTNTSTIPLPPPFHPPPPAPINTAKRVHTRPPTRTRTHTHKQTHTHTRPSPIRIAYALHSMKIRQSPDDIYTFSLFSLASPPLPPLSCLALSFLPLYIHMLYSTLTSRAQTCTSPSLRKSTKYWKAWANQKIVRCDLN